MRIMKREDMDNVRLELHVDSMYITIKRLRPRVGGGWYVKDILWFPWPWTYVA